MVSNDVTCIISNGVKYTKTRIKLKQLCPPRPILSIGQQKKASKSHSFVWKLSILI